MTPQEMRKELEPTGKVGIWTGARKVECSDIAFRVLKNQQERHFYSNKDQYTQCVIAKIC